MNSNRSLRPFLHLVSGVQSQKQAIRSRAPSKSDQEAANAVTDALRTTNRKLVGKAHVLLNSRQFHFTSHVNDSGTYLMIQRWIDGLAYSVHFGPERAVAVVVNLDNLQAQAFVYAIADYSAYKTTRLPTPLHQPLELPLTPGGHIAIANKLVNLLNEMHGIDSVSGLDSSTLQRKTNNV